MEKVLFLAHVESDGRLGKVALEALRAAVELVRGGAALTVGLIGGQVQVAAEELAGCGAARFLGVAGEEFAVSRYSSDAAGLTALVKAAAPTLVVAPGTARFCRVMPGVAQRVGGRIDTQVVGIADSAGDLKIQRWYYRQRLVVALTRTQRPWFLLIAAGAFAPWTGGEAKAVSIERVAVDLPEAVQRTQVLGREVAKAGASTIRPDAPLLLVAGAGWTKKQADGQTHLKEAEALILEFLERTQASLGSSKSLVDQQSESGAVLSFLSHLNQVGQTGSTPRHPKGLATCCHGEEPHVVGWRFIGERRAVNLDPHCGWARGKADVLYVADAFAVIKRVNELLAG